MFYYFCSIRKCFGQEWTYDGLSKPNNILQSTVGYEALLKILVLIMNENPQSEYSESFFDTYIERLKGLDVTKFPMSTIGKKLFYDSLFVKLFPHNSSVGDVQKEMEDLWKKV